MMPDTKPDLNFNEDGVCSACQSYDNRDEVDWDKRANELEEVLARYRISDGSNWDCIVPVSGGKDSTYQVIKMLELGMNPLCVNATTCDLSPIGKRNVENIKKLGVDFMEFSPNPNVRKKLNRVGLTQVGDVAWPEHVGIFTIPVRASVQYNVPLIIWGENSQNEYGGPAAASDNNVLDRSWLEEFGGLLGLRVSDLEGQENITQKDLIPYSYPTNEELSSTGTTGLFLGHYTPWDGLTNVLLSQAHGFEVFPTNIETSFLNYENLDNHQHGIHDYFKYIKLGFGRCTDHVCMHVRRGRITRDEACEIIKRHDGRYPATYLGKPLEDILKHIDMTVEEFDKICDQFANKKIFKTDARGNLVKDKEGNMVKMYDAKTDLRVEKQAA